jgi:dCMP deaminase
MPSPADTYMKAAHEAAGNSNCTRRGVGAVIVRDGEVISRGWNGVSDHYSDCRAAGCPRCIEGGPTGSGYELCICLHAEQKAIGDAAARGVRTQDSSLYVNLRPCLQCLSVIKAAGITEVYFDEEWTYSAAFEEIYQAVAREFRYFGRAQSAVRSPSRIRRIA